MRVSHGGSVHYCFYYRLLLQFPNKPCVCVYAILYGKDTDHTGQFLPFQRGTYPLIIVPCRCSCLNYHPLRRSICVGFSSINGSADPMTELLVSNVCRQWLDYQTSISRFQRSCGSAVGLYIDLASSLDPLSSSHL